MPRWKTLRHCLVGILLPLAPTLGGAQEKTFYPGSFYAVTFSADGKWLAIACTDRTDTKQPKRVVKVWDLAQEQFVRTLDLKFLPSRAVAFAPDGKWLAILDNDRVLHLWDTATWQPTRSWTTTTPNGDGYMTLAFAPDGQTLATGALDVQLWDPATGRELARLPWAGSLIGRVAFSPDGKTLAAADIAGGLRLWDVATRTIRLTLPPEAPVAEGTPTLAFAPDGTTLVLGGQRDNFLHVVDVATGARRRGGVKERGTVGVAYTPDGALVVAAGGLRVFLWDPVGRREVAEIAGRGYLKDLAVSPDGKWLAGATSNQRVHLWDLKKFRENLPKK